MERRKFIKVTSLSGIAIAGIDPLFSWSYNEAYNPEKLKEHALLAFYRFKDVWDFKDFWKRGNTFDACLVFVDALRTQWPKDPEVIAVQKTVESMLEQNIDFFHSYNPGKLWADDFGWWGLMALNAREHLLKNNNTELANKYLELSTDFCWEYKKKTAYDSTKNANPVIHGCRNGDANGENLGVKNTVTNVLLFLLSTRIYRLSLKTNIPESDKYLDMAYRQWIWFNNWFKLKDYEYLKELTTSGALVQERPMAFFEGSTYQEKIHPPWAEGWIWTGDQGMLVAALTDMLAIKNELADYLISQKIDLSFDVDAYEITLRDLLNKLGHGVKNALVSNVDGILREAPCLSSFGPKHGRDYLAGRGIMMRYLSEREITELINVDLSANVSKTAQAIWQTRDVKNNQFQPEVTTLENDKLYVEQFRTLCGTADNVHKWDLEIMKEQNKNGVCQAVGLDILGAAIRMNSTS